MEHADIQIIKFSKKIQMIFFCTVLLFLQKNMFLKKSSEFSPFAYGFFDVYFSGDFTLDINPVDLDDDARFQCQIGAADGIKPIRSQYATLTVLVPPDPPKLMPTGDLLKTVEGRQVELRCESRGGKPASEVFMFFFFSLLYSVFNCKKCDFS